MVLIQISMQKLEKTKKKNDNIKNIIIKKKEKKDVIMLSAEDYEEKILHAEIAEKLEKSENDIRHGRVKTAEEVFKELREKYGY